ncbi:hypothetical protein RRG08_026878 [Elysia crispata]|nr:hypothetical protein RRG08_026878 [Elysia crispata]
MVGTIKRNKRFLPKAFQEKKTHIPLGESKFLFRHETTFVSFQNKREKNVLLLSTMHIKAEVGDNDKPDIVLTYNKTKGGVDAMDQMTQAFTTKRKSKRWPMVYFFNILDLASIVAKSHNLHLSKPQQRLQKLTGQLGSKSNAHTAMQKRIGKQKLSAIDVNGTFAKITLCSSAKIVLS